MMDIVKLMKSLGLETLLDTTENQSYIKQENETADDFVRRLPPSKILGLGHTGFISVNSDRNDNGLESFLKKGEQLMKSYEEIYANETDEAQRELLAEQLKQQIILLAKEEKFLEGRWLLFPSANEVDDVWLKIVQRTMAGGLGINARIDRRVSEYVIRVYTKDFTDEVDVRRVLESLKDLKLWYDGGIHYKCTAFSKLNIALGNCFNISPSIYRSKDLIKLEGNQKDSFYGIKKENESAESFVARLLPTNVLHSKNGFITIFNNEDDINRFAVKGVGDLILQNYKCQMENTSGLERKSITQELQNKLTELAVECKFVKGRWIVFPKDNIDSLWLKTVEWTMNGNLGVNAIIQKYENQYQIRVITRDFNDKADVMRVLAEMKKLGFEPPLFYKSHLYLQLNIFKNNDYGLIPNIHMVHTWENQGHRFEETDKN